MIETLLILQLITVVAFVPAVDGGYTQYDIVINQDNTEFIASTDTRYFHVVGYSPEQFTKQMLHLWDYERNWWNL